MPLLAFNDVRWHFLHGVVFLVITYFTLHHYGVDNIWRTIYAVSKNFVCVCNVRTAFLRATEDIKHGGVATVQDFYDSARKGTTTFNIISIFMCDDTLLEMWSSCLLQ